VPPCCSETALPLYLLGGRSTFRNASPEAEILGRLLAASGAATIIVMPAQR
jgi:hypothetical protein